MSQCRRSTLRWEEAVRIDWGIVLLFGGGLAMGELAFSTGLAEAMGRGLTEWLPTKSALTLTILFTAVGIVMSEAASNTAWTLFASSAPISDSTEGTMRLRVGAGSSVGPSGGGGGGVLHAAATRASAATAGARSALDMLDQPRSMLAAMTTRWISLVPS